jgi:hypothetical protein
MTRMPAASERLERLFQDIGVEGGAVSRVDRFRSDGKNLLDAAPEKRHLFGEEGQAGTDPKGKHVHLQIERS